MGDLERWRETIIDFKAVLSNRASCNLGTVLESTVPSKVATSHLGLLCT